MRSFKEFITEKWHASPGYDDLHHTSEIHGKKVMIAFTKHDVNYRTGKKHGGEWKIDFYVDGTSVKRHEMKPEHGREILHHVHRVVSHFINKKKPSSLVMDGDTERKNQVYHRFAGSLQRSHGADVKSRYDGVRVVFPEDCNLIEANLDDIFEEIAELL